MSEVLEQVKSAAYASVGVNLLVTDAIVGREVPTPDFIEEHATLARKHATKALKEFRAFTEPRAAKLSGQLPSRVADVISDNRNKAWDFIGIEAPELGAAATTTTKRPTAKVKKPASGTKTTDTKTTDTKTTDTKTTTAKTAAKASKPAGTKTAESVKADGGTAEA